MTMTIPPTHCTLCPRHCGADRRTQPGDCRGGARVKVASAAPHHGEERCLSGRMGSGTVFFSGCSLGCIFCQNYDLRDATRGKEMDIDELAQLFLRMQTQGVHNLNLVTPTHYRPWIVQAYELAKQGGLDLPLVWNTSGYETLEAIDELNDVVDIYLYDMKFYSTELSDRLAAAPDYFDVAMAALVAAQTQTGPPVLAENGLMKSGVLVRMLVLPGHTSDAIHILEQMLARLPKGGLLLNLMGQYAPYGGDTLPPELRRRLNMRELSKVQEAAQKMGYENWQMQ